MPGNNQIRFGIGFDVNESGLNKLKQSLQDIQKLTGKDLMGTGNFSNLKQAEQELQKIKQSAAQIQDALRAAFNAQLGTINITRFNQELQKLNLNQVAAQFNSIGQVGQTAFLNLTKQALTLNAPLKQNVNWLNKIGETLANTIKWRVATSAVNTFTGAISSAFNYVKALDSSLTDIRIVTGQSRDEMAAFADQANEAAQALGRQTKEYTNAALAYYQQGLNNQEVQQRTETTLKAQNITGAGTEMTDYLTAVWNGYKVVNDEIELYVDKLAAVADSSASNMAELATGMSKVAATANNMGVNIDQLTAQLATIIATTRQAPETVGNALKTIYARINDIKAGTDDAEISLGNYTKKMASLGINVLDSNNELRATGEVMEEIGAKWDTMTREQQVYLAQTMAGQRQMNNLIALFDSWEQYSEMLNVSLNAQGTLNEKNARYMDSVTAHINQFKAATEEMQQALLDPEKIMDIYDAGTKLMNLFTSFIQSIGGMEGVLVGLGALGTTVFQKQIGEAIFVAVQNLRAMSQQMQDLAARQQVLAMFNTAQFNPTGNANFDAAIQSLIQMANAAERYRGVMTAADQEVLNGLIATRAELDSVALKYQDIVQQAIQYSNIGANFSAQYGDSINTGDLQFSDIFDNFDLVNNKIEVNEQNLKTLIESVTYAREEYKAFATQASNLQEPVRASRQLKAELEAQQKVVKNLEEEYKKYQLQAENNPVVAARQVERNASLEREREKLKELEAAYDEVKTRLNDFVAVVKQAAESETGFGTETERVKTLLEQLGQPGNDDVRTLTALLAIFEKGQGDCADFVQELRKMIPVLRETKAGMDDNTQAAQTFLAVLKDKTFAQGMSSMLRGVGSLAMAYQSLTSVLKTYQDMQEGNIKSSEGWTRIILGLSMGLSTATTGFKALGKGISQVGSILGGFIVNTDLGGKALQAIGLQAGAGAAGLITFGSQLLLVTSVVAAAAAAIWLLVKAGKGIYDWLTRSAQEYERQEKILEEHKQKLSEVTSQYKELKSTIESYQDAREALTQLTQGTEEWKEAIENANTQAKKLIELWPELAGKVKIDANGNIIISDQDLQNAKQSASYNAVMAEADVVQSNLNVATGKVNTAAEGISSSNQAEIVATSRKIVAQNGLADAILLTWDEIWNEALQQIGGHAPHNLKEVQAVNDYIREHLDANLSDFDISILREYGNNLEPVFNALQEEALVISNYQSNLATSLLPLLENIQTSHQGLIASLMAMDIKTTAFDETTGEFDQKMVKAILDNVNTYVSKVENLGKDLDIEIENALFEAINNKSIDTSGLTREQRIQIKNILLEHLKDFGLTADDFRSITAGAEEQQDAAFEQIRHSLSESVLRIYDALKLEDITSPANAKKIAELLRTLFINDYEYGLDSVQEILNKVGPENKEKVAKILANILPDTTLEDLEQQFADAGISTDNFRTALEQLINTMQLDKLPTTFASISEPYAKAKKQTNKLNYGDTVDDSGYADILAFDEGLAQFFDITMEGLYKLKISGEELNKIMDNMALDRMHEGLSLINSDIEQLTQLSQAAGTGDLAMQYENGYGLTFDRKAALARAQYINQTGGAGDYTAEQAADLANRIGNNEIIDGSEIELLNKAWQSALGIEEAIKLAADEAEKFSTALGNNHELDSDVSVDDLEKRAQFLAEYGKEIYGISQDLQDNHEAAALIAEDLLRAEHAAKEIEENIEDWRDAFKDPQKDLGKYIDALDDADNAYKDLLNLVDDAHLSREFLESAENLELMERAIQGGTEGMEAYVELADRAQQDLIDQSIRDFIDGNAELEIPASVDIESLENDLMSKIDMAEASIEDIEIGTALDDANFIAGLNEIINAAGMTAEQATALLASMGIDADVVTGPPEDTTTPASFSYYSPPTYTMENQGMMTTATGGQIPFIAPSIATEGQIITETQSQINTSPSAFAIHVENAKKGVGSGGNINHKKAGGLGGGGGSGKKGGGGGGGGSKQPKKKTTEAFKSKIDPYHDVNIKIGDVQEGLNKLEKQRDKLIGKPAITNLTKQINLMEKEKELLKEKAAIAQEELQKQGQELANLGAIFNKNGDIANYKQLLADKQDQINKAIAIANGLEGDEQEAYLKYVDQLKKEYKELEDGIKNFDETKQLLDDLGEDYRDLIDKQIEKAIEAFDLEINVKLDLQDAEKEFNDFRKKVIDKVKDDQHGALTEAAARNYSQYYNVDNKGRVGGLVPELTKHVKDIQRETEIIRNGGFSQIYGDNLAAAQEDLKKYNDELMNALEEAQDVIDETHDHFLDAIDAMDEAFDSQQENLDKIDDLLQHDMEILQLIHGEENFDEMDRLWGQQIDQDNQRLQALQQEQQYWSDKVKQYEKGTDEWKKAMENWQDAFEKTNDYMITAVENLQSKWENSINSIMSSLRNQTYGGNMVGALEDWDKMNWHSDRYLDSLERATGLLDLQDKYQQAINKTNDPRLQAKLAELEEKQLNALSEKEHLREIDLKISEQQLTVLQAQMALEDAQQAKTKLRLRRDSQGNYTYQYVADEENIESKTQEYANALADYRAMVKDSLHEDLQDLSDYTQEFYDKMQEAQMKYGDDTEALMEEQKRLYELYMGEDGYITRLASDAQNSMQDLQEATFIQAMGLNDLLEEDLFNKFLGPDAKVNQAIHDLLDAGGEIPSLIDAFINDSAMVAFDKISEKTKDVLSGPEGLLPEWQSALWTLAEDYETDFVPRVIDSMNQLQMANQAYVDGLAIMQTAVNRTTEQMALGLAYDTAYTNALNEATQTLLTTQDAELNQAEKVYESLKKNEDAFKSQTQAAIDAANALFLYWLALNGQTASGLPYSIGGNQPNLTITQPDIRSNQPSYTASPSYNSGGSGGGSSGGSGSNNTGSPSTSTTQTYDSRGIPMQYSPGGSSTYRSSNRGLVRYGTGGYTGEWGNDGKLAVLDQKELVLNADDTKNMLNAVSIVRSIADKVNAAAGAAAANLSGNTLFDMITNAGEQILQNVVINADFPAVQDAAQIKQAFNELVNLASQRASSNRRVSD